MLVRIYQPVGHPARVLVPNERLRRPDESDADFLARMATGAKEADRTLADLPTVDVEPSALPADRDFRSAWRVSGRGVQVDMPIAREIHKARLREVRAPKLAELDVAQLREIEKGPQGRPQDIAAQKQTLRDLTTAPAIAAAADVDALRAAWPTALLGPSPYRGGRA